MPSHPIYNSFPPPPLLPVIHARVRPSFIPGLGFDIRGGTVLLAAAFDQHEFDIAIAAHPWRWFIARISQYCPLLLDADLIRGS